MQRVQYKINCWLTRLLLQKVSTVTLTHTLFLFTVPFLLTFSLFTVYIFCIVTIVVWIPKLWPLCGFPAEINNWVNWNFVFVSEWIDSTAKLNGELDSISARYTAVYSTCYWPISSWKPPTGKRQVPVTNCSSRVRFSLSSSRTNCHIIQDNHWPMRKRWLLNEYPYLNLIEH